MIKSKIVDGGGSGEQTLVKDNALLVTQYPCPPLLPQKNKVFSQYLTVDGLASGSNDLGVDGTATNVTHWIPADNDNDIYISKIVFIVGYGASAGLWEFADSDAALTDGVLLAYEDSKKVETEIVDITTNYDLLATSLSSGIIQTAWELRNLGAANDYGILCAIDLTQLVSPYGIKIDRGSAQRLTITVRDDCRDADTFTCKAYGFERFE